MYFLKEGAKVSLVNLHDIPDFLLRGTIKHISRRSRDDGENLYLVELEGKDEVWVTWREILPSEDREF